jgi:hypothetical protein
MTNPVYVQSAFRGRNNDGNLSTATYKGTANNQNFSQSLDETFRIRLVLQNTATAKASANQVYDLYYSRNGGTYTQITSSSSFIRLIDENQGIADHAATSQQIGSGTYDSSSSLGYNDGTTNNLTGGCNIAAASEIEIECSLVLRSADTSVNDTFDLRLRRNGAVLDTYTVTPRVTASSSGATYAAAGQSFTWAVGSGAVGKIIDCTFPSQTVRVLKKKSSKSYQARRVISRAILFTAQTKRDLRKLLTKSFSFVRTLIKKTIPESFAEIGFQDMGWTFHPTDASVSFRIENDPWSGDSLFVKIEGESKSAQGNYAELIATPSTDFFPPDGGFSAGSYLVGFYPQYAYYDYICNHFTNGASNSNRFAGVKVFDSDDNLLAECFSADSFVNGTGSFSKPGNYAPFSAPLKATNDIKIRIYYDLATTSGASPKVEFSTDYVSFVFLIKDIDVEPEVFTAQTLRRLTREVYFDYQTRRIINKLQLFSAQTVRGLRLLVERANQTVRNIISSIFSSYQTKRGIALLLSKVYQGERVIVSLLSKSYQSIRELKVLQSLSFQTKRGVIVAVIFISQAIRAITIKKSSSYQTSRVLKLLQNFSSQTKRGRQKITSFLAQTKRSLVSDILALFEAQAVREIIAKQDFIGATKRSTTLIIEFLGQTTRRLNSVVAYSAQTLRNLTTNIIATFNGATKRVIQNLSSLQFQTRRGVSSLLSSSYQTSRELVSLLSSSYQTLRGMLNTTFFHGQTKRSVSENISTLFQTKRLTVISQEFSAATSREVRALISFLSQTTRSLASTVFTYFQTLRDKIKVVITDKVFLDLLGIGISSQASLRNKKKKEDGG